MEKRGCHGGGWGCGGNPDKCSAPDSSVFKTFLTRSNVDSKVLSSGTAFQMTRPGQTYCPQFWPSEVS